MIHAAHAASATMHAAHAASATMAAAHEASPMMHAAHGARGPADDSSAFRLHYVSVVFSYVQPA
jgi:hypothetical protein